MWRVGTRVFAPCCRGGDRLSLCCRRPQTLSFRLRCLALAGVLAGIWAPATAVLYLPIARGCLRREEAGGILLTGSGSGLGPSGQAGSCQGTALPRPRCPAPCQPWRRGRRWRGRAGCPRSHGLWPGLGLPRVFPAPAHPSEGGWKGRIQPGEWGGSTIPQPASRSSALDASQALPVPGLPSLPRPTDGAGLRWGEAHGRSWAVME